MSKIQYLKPLNQVELMKCDSLNCDPLKIFILTLTVALISPQWVWSAFDHAHSKWSSVLKSYQDSKGQVHYKKLKESLTNGKSEFSQYTDTLQSVTESEYSGWTEAQKKAYLINAYNAFTVKLILDHYPVQSIKKIGGLFTKPWSMKFFSLLGGKIKSLDPIEHEWLRPQFRDYRIHAAVNCASVSCPPLRNEAYVPEKLEAQLNDQMTVWLSDPSRNQIDEQKKIVNLSKIFDWYGEDFKTWGKGVPEVLKRHGQGAWSKFDSSYKIKFLDYNWDLNDADSK